MSKPSNLELLLQTAKKDFREKYDFFGAWDRSKDSKWLDGTPTKRSLEQFLADKMRESYYLGCKKEALDRIKALKEKNDI